MLSFHSRKTHSAHCSDILSAILEVFFKEHVSPEYDGFLLLLLLLLLYVVLSVGEEKLHYFSDLGPLDLFYSSLAQSMVLILVRT